MIHAKEYLGPTLWAGRAGHGGNLYTMGWVRLTLPSSGGKYVFFIYPIGSSSLSQMLMLNSLQSAMVSFGSD